ncbi:nuclear transport factor 2 family protein [Mucilaginibacter sp. RS28]|uniref:Nuclear transport factor 2 family protein n=1 Tax=Mucilaginibacter straminoryzae TaxID=2932774 RepID=A0A9X2BAT8_9SPHI|nr:nuclear transport factor 2 family protein [Mucilaginibacter straminoryzae]MCJ8209147.1 nuclear transport factor 2 family protein [Mucilaginibacter straminoryzae]
MKHKLKAVLLITLLAMISIGTSPVKAQSKSVNQVAEAVEKLRKAMVDPDAKVLDELVSDSLSYGHSSGVVQTKAQFIESLTSGSSDFVSIDLTDQTIRVVGSTAVVRHILSAATNDKGKGPGNVKIGILLVWVKTKGEWKLLARQAVKV